MSDTLATNLSLRSMAHHERDHKGNIEIADMLDAAADEIERLRKENARLRIRLDSRPELVVIEKPHD